MDELPKYPKLPEALALSCPNDCMDVEMQLEGYANWYNAVYRCPKCGESVVLHYSEDAQMKEIGEYIDEMSDNKSSRKCDNDE